MSRNVKGLYALLHVRVAPEMVDRLNALHDRTSVPYSEFVRGAIERMLDEQEVNDGQNQEPMGRRARRSRA